MDCLRHIILNTLHQGDNKDDDDDDNVEHLKKIFT